MNRLSLVFVALVCLPVAALKAQDIAGPAPLSPKLPAGETAQMPAKSTVKTGYDATQRKVTRIYVDLQGGTNKMEPIAEPRAIRIDDRANVQFVLRALSPLDVCTRTASAPTANAETPAIESITSTVAGLGGITATTGTPNFGALAAQVTSQYSAIFAFDGEIQSHASKAGEEHKQHEVTEKAAAKPCKVTDDPEFDSFNEKYLRFLREAPQLVGDPTDPAQCPELKKEQLQSCATQIADPFLKANSTTQLQLVCQIDAASRELGECGKADYRGHEFQQFKILNNPGIQPIRDLSLNPVATIVTADELQALVDELTAYAADLHKKYDFQAPPAGGGSGGAAAVSVPHLLLVAPTSLAFTPPKTGPIPPVSEAQTLAVTSGGTTDSFTAEPISDSGWLEIRKVGDPTFSTAKISASTGNHGDLTLEVSVMAGVFSDGKPHYGSILITGTGGAKGTTIVTVTAKPPGKPSDCDLKALHDVDEDLDNAKDILSIVTDGNKSLQTAQTALKAAYQAMLKIEDDYHRRLDQKIVQVYSDPKTNTPQLLYQVFDLGTDRKATDAGYLSCVTDIDNTTATTTNINYTLIYQDIPKWTASAGFLASFEPNQVIGITESNTTTNAGPPGTQYFSVTSRAKAQVIPLAYVNYRMFAPLIGHWGSTHENELVTTFSPSFGFGVNPNSGTNQPEFFGGFAIGWNHFMLHPGVHIGRTESLGDGYTYGTAVPTGVTSPPLDWSYHYKFSIGFSVRVAPY